MKYVWAVLACVGLFCLYVFFGLVVFGWSSSSSPFGGVFPQLLLLAVMAAVWRLITKKKAPGVQHEDCRNEKVEPVGNARPQPCKTTWSKNIRVNKNILVGLAIALALIFLVGAISALLRKTDWQEVSATKYPPEVLYLNYETLGGRSGLEKGIFAIRHRGQTLMLYKTSAYDYKHETPVKTLEGVVSFQIERIDGERYKRDLFIEQLEEDKKRLSAQAEAAGKRLEELQQRGLGKVIRDAERRDSGAYNWKTRKDFAGSVREKYPIYNGCSDEQLYQHITKLFPEYIEQIEENFK